MNKQQPSNAQAGIVLAWRWRTHERVEPWHDGPVPEGEHLKRSYKDWIECAYKEIRQPSGAQAGLVDRAAERLRFPDAGFNDWLDDGISDAGHTCRDTISNVAEAWQAWHARDWYDRKVRTMLDASPLPGEPVAARVTDEMINRFSNAFDDSVTAQYDECADHGYAQIFHRSIAVRKGIEAIAPMLAQSPEQPK